MSEDWVDASIQRLKDYIKNSQERLITVANGSNDIIIPIIIIAVNFSVWLGKLDSRSWDRNPADSNADPIVYHTDTRKPA